jgi:hypothetical protein
MALKGLLDRGRVGVVGWGMKTIYLFGRIGIGGIRGKRVSECAVVEEGERHVATLYGQPDNYWELFDASVAVKEEGLLKG